MTLEITTYARPVSAAGIAPPAPRSRSPGASDGCETSPRRAAGAAPPSSPTRAPGGTVGTKLERNMAGCFGENLPIYTYM